jgi:hypothetical protein
VFAHKGVFEQFFESAAALWSTRKALNSGPKKNNPDRLTAIRINMGDDVSHENSAQGND